MIKQNEKEVLSGSEAVYGFLAWLMCRDTSVTFSAVHNATEAAKLAEEFCEVNSLPDPRENWTKYLTRPKEVKNND